MVLGIFSLTFVATPTVAHADTNPGTAASSYGQTSTTYSVYVQAGETLDVSFATTQQSANVSMAFRITDTAGSVLYTCNTPAGPAGVGTTCAKTGLTGDPGVWKIETPLTGSGVNSGASSYNWNITPRTSAGIAVAGRVWTNDYFTFNSDATDQRYYMLNDSGYLYDTVLNGYNGVFSDIAPDAVGNVLDKNTCIPAYHSLDSGGVVSSTSNLNCGRYRIFFAPPAADLPESAPSADGTVFVKPPPLTNADLTIDDLTFTPAAAQAAKGEFAYTLNKRFTGAYQLQIDTNGNGDYTDPVDRTVDLIADGKGSYSYAFDGLDGQGNAIADCTAINARVYLPRVGEIHVTNYDVEGRSGGIQMTRTNGPGAPDSTIHWDDRGLGAKDTTTPVLDGRAGVNSTGGVHGWAYAGDSWGNNRTIDDWAYDPANLVAGQLAVGGRCLSVTKASSAGAATALGSKVTYTVKVKNNGTGTFTPARPATMTDDLSKVLDDSTYNNDAKVSYDGTSTGGTVTRTGNSLKFSGPLAAGETATITYSVTVTNKGDGTLTNNACIPSADAQNPNALCSPTQTQTHELSITKTADASTQDPPKVGDTVTYTVVAKNNGPGDYTAADPAIVDDDLTPVLDDATYVVGSLTASVGTPAYAAPRITWSGPLAAGASVTFTYKVTYTGAGDKELTNVAWQPPPGTTTTTPPPVCDPRNADGTDPTTGLPCGRVDILVPNLVVTKSVNPVDGSTVLAGQKVTYTVSFSNTGAGAAPVTGYTDFLAGVLDDAKLTSAPKASSAALTASAVVDGRFTVNGSVTAGQTVTVTYAVTVLSDDQRGDDNLANVVTDGRPPGPPCQPNDPLSTCNPVADPQVVKSVDPASGTAVKQGQVLTYTLTFTNTGKATGPVHKVDSLTHLLDDATITSTPVSSDPALTVSGVENDAFTINGTIDPGQTITITYKATVKTELGDGVVANFVLDPGTTPPPTPVCDGGPLCTENPVSDITVTKASDPAPGTQLYDGQKVTYTLTFANMGGPSKVDYTDDMTRLLDDATKTGTATSSDAGLQVAGDAHGYRITGMLDGGKTVTVTYAVTVKSYADQGDHSLGNFVTVTGQGTPRICLATSRLCTTHPTAAGAPPNPPAGNPPAANPPAQNPPGLAQTGSSASLAPMGIAGLLAIGLGGWFAVRNRRNSSGNDRRRKE